MYRSFLLYFDGGRRTADGGLSLASRSAVARLPSAVGGLRSPVYRPPPVSLPSGNQTVSLPPRFHYILQLQDMFMIWQYWYMLPISALIATVAMASGVGGATFFGPLLILGLRLPPDVAIGVGLITQMFGFASGVWAYGRKGLIAYRVGFKLLAVAAPAALLGAIVGGLVGAYGLKLLLGVALFGIALAFLRPHERPLLAPLPQAFPPLPDDEESAILTAANGEQFSYPAKLPGAAFLFSGVGGLFLGMVAAGLGELVCYYLLERGQMAGKTAVATTVFVVALAGIPAMFGQALRFAYSGGDNLTLLFNLLIFTIPGVIVGAQMGSGVASRIPQPLLERGLAVLLICLSGVILIEAIVNCLP
jgi:uncharacterized membrane protein YfcA